jgi:MoaA/NifB/PqqE/SkfB family radical SAM enzyme
MKPYNLLFDDNILSVIKTGISMLRDFPDSAGTLKRFLSKLPKASKLRALWKEKGVEVPPILIVSTTEMCNLNCVGCYARTNSQKTENEVPRPQIDKLLEQAAEAGCSIVLLAGGEPLLCDDWLEATASRPEILGLVFTNGTLLDEKRADWFSSHRNMIPLFSIEGDSNATNERRGDGVAQSVGRSMERLSDRAVPFGISVTVGEHNIQDILGDGFHLQFIPLGCRLFIFPEYVPVDESSELQALTEDSKKQLQDFCRKTSKERNLILIPFPGDESAYGGCLAAGRGFAHISATGELEPCPFAAYSDRNVFQTTLVDALASPLFKKIRSESHLLKEGAGGCALRGMVFES